jgi:hypothetical protein
LPWDLGWLPFPTQMQQQQHDLAVLPSERRINRMAHLHRHVQWQPFPGRQQWEASDTVPEHSTRASTVDQFCEWPTDTYTLHATHYTQQAVEVALTLLCKWPSCIIIVVAIWFYTRASQKNVLVYNIIMGYGSKAKFSIGLIIYGHLYTWS